jgi:hypothetical protein
MFGHGPAFDFGGAFVEVPGFTDPRLRGSGRGPERRAARPVRNRISSLARVETGWA